MFFLNTIFIQKHFIQELIRVFLSNVLSFKSAKDQSTILELEQTDR